MGNQNLPKAIVPSGVNKVSPEAKGCEVFGYELLLDLYDCKPGVCDDLSLCYKFLDDIVAYLGMEKQAPPDIFFTDATRFPDKAGLSGWVPLVESSVVIHTLSVKNYISVDIYCCRKFDVDKAKSFTHKFFSPRHMDGQFLLRGIHYYK
jgi:S-adenosylmethionine decarboxylase